MGEPWVLPCCIPIRSWSDRAASARAFAIAWTAAAAPEIVVTHGTRAMSAASRMRYRSPGRRSPAACSRSGRNGLAARDRRRPPPLPLRPRPWRSPAPPGLPTWSVCLSLGRDEGEAEPASAAATGTAAGLSSSRTERKAVPEVGSGRLAARSALASAVGRSAALRHHFAGRAHLGAEHLIAPGSGERQHRCLHADLRRARHWQVESASRGRQRGGTRRRRGSRRSLCSHGTVREARGFTSRT